MPIRAIRLPYSYSMAFSLYPANHISLGQLATWYQAVSIRRASGCMRPDTRQLLCHLHHQPYAFVHVGPIAHSESPTELKGLLLPVGSRPSKAVYTQRRRYRTGLNSLAGWHGLRLSAAREKTQTHGLYLATVKSWLQADYRQ